jgi:hypothetical protein
MGLVRGEDVILTVLQNQENTPVQVPFGCARSITFDISTDFIETSVTDSGAFKTFIPSGKQYSGNIEGLVFINKPAEAETRGFVTWDYTSIPDGAFPDLAAYAYIRVQVPTIDLYLCNIEAQTFTTKSDYINAIKDAVNASGTGYTAVFGSGSTLIITAAPGLGDSVNGTNCIVQIELSTYTNNYGLSFAGGIDAYYPDKLGIGWMYDKLISGEEIFLKYYETDDDNLFLQKQCSVYIESINETSSFDNIVTFSASFKGNGDPIITYGEI